MSYCVKIYIKKYLSILKYRNIEINNTNLLLEFLNKNTNINNFLY